MERLPRAGGRAEPLPDLPGGAQRPRGGTAVAKQDVKQTWKVLLNGKDLARLRPDENDMVVYVSVPAGALHAGENRLVIEQADRTPELTFGPRIRLVYAIPADAPDDFAQVAPGIATVT